MGLGLDLRLNIVTFDPGETLGDYVARAQGDLSSLTAEVERLAEALAREPARFDLQRDYDTTLARLSSVPFETGDAPAALSILGLGSLLPETPITSLSGGQKARLALARVLPAEAQLPLDEPISHVDIPSRARFDQALAVFQGTTLAVVCDRYFIERFATEVWIVENQGLRYDPGRRPPTATGRVR